MLVAGDVGGGVTNAAPLAHRYPLVEVEGVADHAGGGAVAADGDRGGNRGIVGERQGLVALVTQLFGCLDEPE